MLITAALLALALQAAAQSPVPAAATGVKVWPAQEADYVIRDFRFGSGETLPKLRMHYTTLGQPRRNAAGEVDNAVMVLHGTGGNGKQFLRPQFADELFGPGQPLDVRKYWVILPDNVGHGGSSKPSDGMRMSFPAYDYDDMVEAQRRLLTERLGVKRLRLLMGTSMGCMHGFVWGEKHPGFAQAIMPLACQPIEIAGTNRMWRQLIVDGIKSDPAWQNGNYTKQPKQGLRTAQSLLFVAGSAPLFLQREYPTREKATGYVRQSVSTALAALDANDMLYQFESSRNYNPWGGLERIVDPVMWINSADDFINPRNLDVPAKAVKRMKNARFRMIAETADTRGHGTHTWAVNWKADLTDLLARTE